MAARRASLVLRLLALLVLSVLAFATSGASLVLDVLALLESNFVESRAAPLVLSFLALLVQEYK